MAKAFSEFSEIDFDFLPYHVTFSFGSAEFNRLETSVALFERADQKMYTRKKALHARERAAAAAKDSEIQPENETCAYR